MKQSEGMRLKFVILLCTVAVAEGFAASAYERMLKNEPSGQGEKSKRRRSFAELIRFSIRRSL